MAHQPAEETAATPSWTVAAPDCLTWRRLDEDWLVYCGASGSTHCLDVLSATVLSQLQESGRPLGAHDLALRLADGEVPTEAEVARLQDTLATLETAGLLRRD